MDEPAIGPRDVHVWSVQLDGPDRHSRRALARSAQRQLLAHYLRAAPGSVEYEFSTYGKPRLAGGELAGGELAGGELRFNLSHSGEWALVAVSGTLDVGVDIQRPHRAASSTWFAGRICTPAERAVLGPNPDPATLLRLWVRKEAVVKARGDLSYVDAARVDVSHDRIAGGWRCVDVSVPAAAGYQAAVAFTDAPDVDVRLCGRWPAGR